MSLEFKGNVRSLAQKIEGGLRARQQEFLRQWLRSLGDLTPVDTGRLVRNFKIGEAGSVQEPLELGPRGEGRRAANVSAMLLDNESKILDTTPRTDVKITNPVPYAAFVNYGTLRQPAKLFLERALDLTLLRMKTRRF